MTDAAKHRFPGTPLQRCQQDFLTQVLRSVPREKRREFRSKAKHLLSLRDRTSAMAGLVTLKKPAA